MTCTVHEFADSLLKGNQDAAWNIVMNEVGHDISRKDVLENLITKAMQYIGKLWEKDEITVADEHLATSTCEYILVRFDFHMKNTHRFHQVEPRKVMLLCLEKELHDLGIKMVAQLFEENGWNTRLLGPNLPLEEAISFAEKWEPDVIGLSFSIWYHAELLTTYSKALEELPHKPAVIVGGRLLGDYDFSPYVSSRTTLFTSLSDLQEWIKQYSI
ncbi:B12-binding domain-containing protein [Metabacillus niabensis]|uniref:cobalamin B12-binding domain-containing protein n=1 Tax=Metabacillus niabensis TaxID=324854 RepID=UPI001CFC0542|nr:cobalamin-dependent protein [Metabacillus niabensis]